MQHTFELSPIIAKNVISKPNISAFFKDIEEISLINLLKYSDKMRKDRDLTRSLVSFQGNKNLSSFRWYKFKEAFSADLVQLIFDRYKINSGTVLDPFAGSGTTLFSSIENGLSADGIELLPIGQQIILSRNILTGEFSKDDWNTIESWRIQRPWKTYNNRKALTTLRITEGAYPLETQVSIEKYLSLLETESSNVASVLKFALLCILEEVSFTRKDGQYLRWDSRSGHNEGKIPFNKGKIESFDNALSNKLGQFANDINNLEFNTGFFSERKIHGKLNLYCGSCLDILPKIESNKYDCIITSPPYCNRYDYTRTYALELAVLGVEEQKLRNLRQELLTCTVENREKSLIELNRDWEFAVKIADKHVLLQLILSRLNELKASGEINNSGIPRMVRGYFYELSCVMFECLRVLKPGALLIMVNDNVRYGGISIPVDTILSDIAFDLGFSIEEILVLPNGKGNSSQQMGKHGREALRKCVYVWRKKK